MKKLILMLCLVGGCVGAPIQEEAQTTDESAYVVRAEASIAYSGLTVEQVDGETGTQNTGSFSLASGEPVAVVQVWCHDEAAAWYLVPDPKIRDGIVEFQCSAAGPWRALIIH